MANGDVVGIPHGVSCECPRCSPDKTAGIPVVLMESKKGPNEGEMYIPLVLEYFSDRAGTGSQVWYVMYAVYSYYHKTIKMSGYVDLQTWNGMEASV